MASSPVPSALTPRQGTVFIGRDREMQRLRDAWAAAAAGARRTVVVGGEAGVGKTSLAAQLAGIADADGALVIYGSCDDGLLAPYQPFVEALRALVESCAPGELPVRLGPQAGELARLVPRLTQLDPTLSPRPSGDARAAQYLLFEAVVGALQATSSTRPIVLVLDDLQWATKPTLQLLRHVVAAAGPMAVLVIATYRDSEVARGDSVTAMLADLRRLPAVDRITLSGLDADEVLDYVRLVGGRELGARTSEVASALHAQTDGNPFFVREMLTHLIESDQRMPEQVRDVIDRRLARLSPPTLRVLTAAAVAGPAFSASLLEHIPEVANTEDAVLDALEEGLRAGLLHETGRSEFAFSHALVRDALYGGLSTARRLRLHRSVAQALEALPGDPGADRVAELAYHFSLAAPLGCMQEAARYTQAAGALARDSLALEEAAQRFEQALDLLDGTPSSPERTRAQIDVLVALGGVRMAHFGLGDQRVQDVYVRAEELCKELEDAPDRFWILEGIYGYWVGRPDHARAAPIGNDLVALAEARGRRAMLVSAYAWRGSNAYLAGDKDLAASDLDTCLGHYEPGHGAVQLLDPGVTAHIFSAFLDFDAGNVDAAGAQMDEARALARRQGHPFTIAYADLHAAKLAACWRDAPAARELATATERLAEKLGFAQLRHQAACIAGWSDAVRGDADAGTARIAAALAALQDTASMAGASLHMLLLVDALRLAGNHDEARAAVDRAMAVRRGDR